MNGVEHLSDRANHLIDPVLAIWTWQIPVYLFLGGLVAGLMVVGCAQELLRGAAWAKRTSAAAAALGAVLLSAGMLALFWDLEHKLFVWRFYLAFKPLSPMSWGSWILILVYPALLAWLLGSVAWESVPSALRGSRAGALLKWAHGAAARWRRPVLLATAALGVLLGAYTGILLQTLMARPLWSTGLLASLFLASGLSSGAAFLMLLRPPGEAARDLVRWDLAVLVVELAVLALFLLEKGSGDALSREAARLLVTGDFSGAFFGLVVVGGILAPLLLEGGELVGRVHAGPVAPLLVLAGSLRSVLSS